MVRKRGSGGARTPAKPAPVSNPGSGRRTDGGAGQPVRPSSGGDYGDRKTSVEQQSGAPMASGPGAGAPAPGGAGVGGPVPGAPPGAGVPGGGIFGPTERPNESPLAGAMSQGEAAASNADHAIRAMYSKFPHPAIARLMKGVPENRAIQQ